ncbi:M28 family peptidase [Marixanthomonas ophiurae]|uniref:Aminopeptidase n=1 Tax=Marixanthomonas ophiurae TaxID=387659 RepID=A0A3E1Q912_9FLAO|nr:M28 family peptidase [Marixanthomonas ophiurae]RFN58623.1 aminopeptidase [Marixanthomonas ophiurae]
MRQLPIFIALLILTPLLSQTEQEKVKTTVSKSDIEGHIYFLADDLLKGRETGTPENKIAASYLANTLRGYGVKPNPATNSYYQTIPMQEVTPPRRFTLSVDGTEYKNKVVLQTSKMDFTGKAVYVGYGLEDDYNEKNVKEKIVLVQAGGPNAKDARAAFGLREKKAELAKKTGAIGIIEFINAAPQMWGYIDHNFNSKRLEIAETVNQASKEDSFAYVWIQDENGTYADALKSKGEMPINMMMEGENRVKVTSQNVVGLVEGTDPKLKNEYIIYSAHYDHVGVGQPDKTGDTIYNGARDNAVGVTTVLSMAENMAKYPTKRSALFILFTGEEKGLLGSKYYVDNPIVPLDQMVYCFNSDNGGYNDTSIATIVGLTRTTAEKNIEDAASTFGLKANEDPQPENNLFNRSDNVHFAKKGIPSPTFTLGFTDFAQATKHYHRRSDEADTLDYDYLLKFFRAYVLSGRNIANDPTTPFWVSGDLYEEAGKKLYKK